LTDVISYVINNLVVMIFTEHVLDTGAVPVTSTTDTLGLVNRVAANMEVACGVSLLGVKQDRQAN